MTLPFNADSLTDSSVNPYNPDVIEDGYSKRKPAPAQYGDEAPDGDLLKLEPEKAAKRVFKEWKDQDQLHQKHGAQCRANKLRREGHCNVQVVKAQDYDRWEEWSWGGPSVHHLNYAATLCRKAVANMYADPPVPDPVPASGDPDDLDAADFAGRVLEDLCSEAQLDDINQGREAFDLASTFASAFRYFRINPQGSREAVEIEAHPQAVKADQPFSVPTGQPQMDPATGMPALDPQTGQPVPEMQEAPGPYVLRYVAQDGSLTDQRAQAAMQWVPRIEEEIVTSRHVRFLPATAKNVWKAHGAMVGCYKSIAEIKKMFPDETANLTPTMWDDMVKYKPERSDDYLPGRGRGDKNALESMEGENRLVFIITLYYAECPAYPRGAHLVCAGESQTLYQKPWCQPMEDGSEECLLLPLAQYMQFKEGRDGQYGVGLMELLGPGNELRAAQLGAALEYLDQFLGRKTFLPTSSILTPEDLENPTARVLPMNPGGVPVAEEIPEYPAMSTELYQSIQTDMDHTSGLEQAAQGIEDPSVQSGRHARVIVAQIHAGLSEMRQNVERATVRGYRIMLQLVRAFYTKPQKLKWSGNDGRFMEKRWTRADLRSTKDVRLKPATLTMLAPATKIEYVQDLAQMGLIPPEEVRDLLSTSLAATTGWKDEPHRLRIRRQVAEWNEGPPANWQPPMPSPVMGPNNMPIRGPDGQPQMQPPPPDPIWQPVPADELPQVAQIRLIEMAKAMASQSYFRWPPEWRAGLEQEFMHMQMVVQQAMAPAPAPPAPSGKGGGGGSSDQGSSTPEPPPTPAEQSQAA
jgi:hypothetical protein